MSGGPPVGWGWQKKLNAAVSPLPKTSLQIFISMLAKNFMESLCVADEEEDRARIKAFERLSVTSKLLSNEEVRWIIGRSVRKIGQREDITGVIDKIG